jgi:putative hemolysin/putative flippase GtrA
MSRTKKELISNFSGFVISRGLGTVVDTLVLWFCEKLVFTGYWGQYLISPAISFEVATFFNYVLSYYWIWRSRVENKNARIFWHLFGVFNISCIAGFLIKMVFLLLFERLFGFDAVICNLLALCVSGIFNFYLSDWVVFKKKKPAIAHPLLRADDLSELSPFFNGWAGKLFAKALLDIFGVTKINKCYDKIISYEGVEFVSKAIDRLGCNYFIGNAERLETLPEGSFFTISNHPYGGFDGLMISELFGGKRPDYKIMVNDILSIIKSLKSIFITVTPTTTVKKAPDAVTVRGVREIVDHIQGGHPLGCFPSGAVSDYDAKSHTIRDREWQLSMLRMIKRAKVPIVPVHFLDSNSGFFYFLGRISWKIRILRLPREFFNKKRGRHRIVIGETISLEEQEKYPDLAEYGRMLRSRVYDMPVPGDFIARAEYLSK